MSLGFLMPNPPPPSAQESESAPILANWLARRFAADGVGCGVMIPGWRRYNAREESRLMATPHQERGPGDRGN